MGTYIQIPNGLQIQVKKTMHSPEGQHMVQKGHPSVYGGLSLTIYLETQVYVCFLCSPLDLCIS